MAMPRGQTTSRVIGLALIVLGVVANKWTLERVLSSDQSIDSPVFVIAVWVMDLALIAAGIILLRGRTLNLKGLAFGGVTIVIVLLLVEVVLHAVNLFGGTSPDPRSLRTPYQNEWGPELWAEVGDFTLSPATWTYHPHLSWDTNAYTGKWINVDERGVRRTWNPEFADPDAVPTIYFFGGSTTWGMGARDEHSVPSYLSKTLAEKGIDCRVENYGDLAYTFTQELINLQLLLKDGHRPDVVVFYDGVNDTYGAYESGVAGTPPNVFDLPNRFSERWTPVEHLVAGVKGVITRYSMIYRYADRLGRRLSDTPAYFEAASTWDDPALRGLARDVVDYYASSHAVLETLAEDYGFRYVTFWQPTSYTEANLFEEEQEELRTRDPALRVVHGAALEALAERSIPNLFDISDALADRKTTFYVDEYHLSEEGNAVVAARIAEILEREGVMAAE
jgi:lysophospholipase L1-like esterase